MTINLVHSDYFKECVLISDSNDQRVISLLFSVTHTVP